MGRSVYWLSTESLQLGPTPLTTASNASSTGLFDTGSTSTVKIRDRASIVIRFTCGQSVDPQKCNYALAAYQRNAQRLTDLLVLREDVVVDARFLSFCVDVASSEASCGTSTLGRALPYSFLSGSLVRSKHASIQEASDGANLATTTHMYPQALVKQLQANVTLHFNETDVLAEFNADQSFYFPEMGNQMTSDQFDFEYVVLHELVHGLGFTTGWTLANTTAAGGYGLVPPTSTNSNGNASWLFPLVFDAYLATANGTRLDSYASTVTSFKITDYGAQWPDKLAASPQFASAQAVFQLASSNEGALVYRLPAIDSYLPDSVVLYTKAAQFSSGSSIVHVGAISADRTPDFLMRPVVSKGTTLQNLTQTYCGNWRFGALGPKTIRVLQTLGYTTVNDAAAQSADAVGSVDLGTFVAFSSTPYSNVNVPPPSSSSSSIRISVGLLATVLFGTILYGL